MFVILFKSTNISCQGCEDNADWHHGGKKFHNYNTHTPSHTHRHATNTCISSS